MDDPPQRLEIRLKQPNPIFEKWLERWLSDAERRNNKSQHRLREALQSLRSYPLPIQSGRECAILRGFGTKLCQAIDDELRHLESIKPANNVANTSIIFQKDVKLMVSSVKKVKRTRKSPKKTNKLTKKQQQAAADEFERQRQINMAPGDFTVLLLIDVQETNGKNKNQLDQTSKNLDKLDVQYEVRRLTLGDFLWIARDATGGELVLPYIIERKRMDDLASSIRDGRFHEQKHRLQNCGIQNVIYLVEDYGDNSHISLPLESLQQAIINTQVHSGFTIVHTENHWRSMVYLKNMTKTLIQNYKCKMLIGTAKEDLMPSKSDDKMVGLLKFRSLYEDSARNSQLTVREVFVQQLLQLHSLSLERALAIVELYPTPRLLLDAYECCESVKEARSLLSQIRCGPLQRPIGDKISETIYDFYNIDFQD